MVRKAATAWGDALVVDEVRLPQRAGAKRFAAVVQLLAEDGEEYLRFAYTTDGTVRRGPVTFRRRDLERLRASLGEHPDIARALRALAEGGGAEGGG
jgi:hypothetical protein